MDSSSHMTRPSLLVRLRDVQDAEAWQIFVDQYGPLIMGYLKRWRIQDADVLDLTQNLLIKLITALRSFEYDQRRGRFRDWMGVVIRRHIQEHFRSRRAAGQEVNGVDLDLITSPGVEADWAARFNDHILRSALDRIQGEFQPANWRAFELTWMENHTAEQAARILELSVQNIYVARSRILRRLKEEVLVLADEMPLHLKESGETDDGTT